MTCRDKLTLAVLKLREDGELDKLQKFWWVEKGQCTPQDKNTVSKLKISPPHPHSTNPLFFTCHSRCLIYNF